MNRIKKLREEKGMLQEELAQILGVTQKTISNYETEARDIPTKYIVQLSEFFEVSADYLLGKEQQNINIQRFASNAPESNAFPISDQPITIPVLGKISAGLPILATENIEGYEFAPSSFIKSDYEYFYLKVSGDSMNLKFPEGNLVLVQKQDTLENGDIGVILVDGSDATVKKYRQENGLVILDPMSSNPEHVSQIYNPVSIDVKIIGKVILHIGKV